MKKFLSFLKKYIILIPLICLVILMVSQLILALFDLIYRQKVYLISLAIIIPLFILGIFQILLRLKRSRIILIGLFLILLIIGAYFGYVVFIFSYMPEYVIQKDEKKYVAYVNGFWTTQVDYYEYKGPLLTSIYKSFTEDYGKGGFNPIENSFGYKYEIEQTIYYDAKGNILKCEKNELVNKDSGYITESEKTKSYFNINTVEGVEFQEEPSGCYAISNDILLAKIISYNEAADIADEEAKNSKYQYQSWKSEFYSRGKLNNQVLDAKLCYGLEEIDRLYMWEEEWKVSDYNDKLMWQIGLFDENDPLTSLYIYVDAKDGSIVGAGKMSD